MQRKCRCHGHSGSCTTKTCWKRLPSMAEVGEMLKRRLAGAQRVKQTNNGRQLVAMTSPASVAQSHRTANRQRPRRRKNIRKKELIYAQPSPNYCLPDRRGRWPGTANRRCEAEGRGVGSCEFLCCERGHYNVTNRTQENCNCTIKLVNGKFNVECDICQVKRTLQFCH